VWGKARLAVGTDSVQQPRCPTIQVPVRAYWGPKFAIIALGRKREIRFNCFKPAWWEISCVEGRGSPPQEEIQMLNPVVRKFKLLICGSKTAWMEFQTYRSSRKEGPAKFVFVSLRGVVCDWLQLLLAAHR